VARVASLDELGWLALPNGAAELVFGVLFERHERGLTRARRSRPTASRRCGVGRGGRRLTARAVDLVVR